MQILRTYKAFPIDPHADLEFEPVGIDQVISLKNSGVDNVIPGITLIRTEGDTSGAEAEQQVLEWCEENGFRPATGYELVALKRLAPLSSEEHDTLSFVIALGSEHEGKHIFLSSGYFDGSPGLIERDKMIPKEKSFAVVQK